MDNNLITSTTESYGLYLYNYSSPNLVNNSIKGDMYDYAVKVYAYSQPQFGTKTNNSTYGNNRIEHNSGDFSLLADNHAWPFLGSTYICPYQGEKNTVKGNDVAALVVANNYSTVDAEYVWWGQYPAPTGKFSAEGTSHIDYDYALQSDPGGGSSLGKVLADNFNEPLVNASSFSSPAECDSLWELAEKYRKAGESDSAIAVYKTLIDQFSYTPKAHYSLVRIVSLSQTKDITATNDYMSSLVTKECIDVKLQASSNEVLVSNYCDMRDFKSAIQTAEQIIQQFPKSEHEYTALFNLFNMYQKDLTDESTAKKYLELLKTNYSDYELTLIARFDMGEPVEWKLAKRFVPQPPAATQTVAVPKEYRLGMNFPNPFNPSTVIPYELPEA